MPIKNCELGAKTISTFWASWQAGWGGYDLKLSALFYYWASQVSPPCSLIFASLIGSYGEIGHVCGLCYPPVSISLYLAWWCRHSAFLCAPWLPCTWTCTVPACPATLAAYQSAIIPLAQFRPVFFPRSPISYASQAIASLVLRFRSGLSWAAVSIYWWSPSLHLSSD